MIARSVIARPIIGAQRWWGLLRSLLIYYGAPGRARRDRRFYSQFIHPGDLCFDLGAHVGNRLRVFLALGARRVVAAEPQPLFFRFLESVYGQNPSVNLVQAALGARPGWATLHISRRTPTVTTLSTPWMQAVTQAGSFARVRWEDAMQVRVTTLDALIAEHGRPAFCKIDVEGGELEALHGLSQPIPALSMEYIPAAVGMTLACMERLEQLAAYEYNWSRGEEQRLASPGWLGPAEMAARLARLDLNQPSGDLYARLRPGARPSLQP